MEGTPETPDTPMQGTPEPPCTPMEGAEEQLRSLLAEATCPICLGYFAQPVSVQCGHTFCTPCITRYWEGVQGPYPCPQCQETAPSNTLRCNRHLARIVQILAQGPPVAPSGKGPHMCTEHEEKLKLFCGADRTPICVICSQESRGRRDHTVTLTRETDQEYQEKCQRHLAKMRVKLEKICKLRLGEDTHLTDAEEKFEIQRERITRVFNMVQQSLEKERFHHLRKLEEREERTQQEIRDKMMALDQKQALLRNYITDIESACQQPDVELQKEVKSILSRYADPNPTSQLFEMEENIVEIETKPEEGEEHLEKTITESLELRWARRFAGVVTLDPDTAHRKLIVSEDGRSVRHGYRARNRPDLPERYAPALIVLGRESLKSGRHYWEVEVGNKTRWDLGVCDMFASRKGVVTLSPEDGYWAVWLRDGKYKALTSPHTLLAPSLPPTVVGLFLDYEVGRLSIYNVTDRSLLFTFSGVSFPHTLQPFFSPGPGQRGKNVGVLRILPVVEWECE